MVSNPPLCIVCGGFHRPSAQAVDRPPGAVLVPVRDYKAFNGRLPKRSLSLGTWDSHMPVAPFE